MATVRNPETFYPFTKPFFKDGCVVKRNNRTLVEGVDYYFGHFYVTGTLRHGKSAYGSIWLYNKANINGLTVTAEQLPYGEAIQEQIDIEIEENGSVIAPVRFWDDVLKEHHYPPINIEFDEENWHGELELMNSIKSGADALLAKDPKDDDLYEIAEIWLNTIESIFLRSPAHDHVVNPHNPHREEYNWIGALMRDGYAANADKLYGFTLAELAKYINERSAKAHDLEPKILKLGKKIIKNVMRFKNGIGYVSTTGTDIAVNNEMVAVSAKGNISISSNHGQPIVLAGGENKLILYPDERELEFNGEPLLTLENIGPHLPKAGGVSYEFHFKDNFNMGMSGRGTKKDPIKMSWVKQEGEPDLIQVSKSTGTSEILAAHISLLKRYNLAYNDKLVIGKATVNGVVISETTTVNKVSFGLGNVENVSDKDMDVSDAQSELFRQYADSDHTHDSSEFGLVSATDTVTGLVRFRDDGTDFEEGDEPILPLPYDIATPETMLTVLNTVKVAEDSESLLPAAAIKIIRYGLSGNGLVDSVIVGNILKIPKEVPYYVGTLYMSPVTDINLSDVYGAATGIGYVYVTLDLGNGKVSYTVSLTELAENSVMTLAGKVSKNTDGSYRAVLRNRTRLGNFVELKEHGEDNNAHAGLTVNKDKIGLGTVVNMRPSFSINKPTFSEVFSTWRRFSHGALSTGAADDHAGVGTAQPANAAGLNGWEYNEVEDSLVMPFNTGSGVGFVSPEKYENYVFDTVLKSNAGDNDYIGVLIGFYVDSAGVEHTLTVLVENQNISNPLTGSKSNIHVYDNFMQGGSSDRVQAHLFSAKTLTTTSSASNWSVIGTIRIRVERRGNMFAIDIFKFSGSYDTTDNTLVETLVFRLDSQTINSVDYTAASPVVSKMTQPLIPTRGAKYLNRSNFGYVSMSQPNSTYVNLIRPDEDSRNFYATLPGLLDSVSYFSKKRTFIETTPLVNNGINHLQTMPDGVSVETYAGIKTIPWERYMYDQPNSNYGGFESRRVGILNMDKEVLRPVSTLFEDRTVADSFERPYDIETLTW